MASSDKVFYEESTVDRFNGNFYHCSRIFTVKYTKISLNFKERIIKNVKKVAFIRERVQNTVYFIALIHFGRSYAGNTDTVFNGIDNR